VLLRQSRVQSERLFYRSKRTGPQYGQDKEMRYMPLPKRTWWCNV